MRPALHIFNYLAIIVVSCMMTLVSCESYEETTTQEYVDKYWKPVISKDIEQIGGNVTSFYVVDFQEIPVDTLYEFTIYAENELRSARELYETKKSYVKEMEGYRDSMTETFGDSFNSAETETYIEDLMVELHNDSIVYAKALTKHGSLKTNRVVHAYGYVFNILVVADFPSDSLRPSRTERMHFPSYIRIDCNGNVCHFKKDTLDSNSRFGI